MNSRLVITTISIFLYCLLQIPGGAASAQSFNESTLVSALREGGFIIVMRHASSPQEAPGAATANADNPERERQLDETGRRGAIAMGESLRALGIPITEVESSPTYRTLETARLAGFEQVLIRDYLGNRGMADSGQQFAARLRANLAIAPAGGNRLLITHSPNISAAFPDLDPAIEQGEALIFDPGISLRQPVARVRIETWTDLQ